MPQALITGAGVRLGRATALALGMAGFDLILHAHNSLEGLVDVQRELEAQGRSIKLIRADLSTVEGVDAIAAMAHTTTTALDVIVHNAGIFERSAFEDISRDQYRRMQAINLEAPFFLTQALLTLLRAAPSPSVIHLTDIGGERAVSHYAHYGISKAGLIMLTKQLAVELAPHIRVNAISPGTVSFPESFTAEQRASHLQRVPIGHEGTPEDIAKTVLFLVRDAPYITGHILTVDGGRSARL